jgi:UDP-glucuronate 4-epimerase
MTILVTGGAGFIGSHLLDRLARTDAGLVCIDNFNDYYSPAVKRRNIEPLVREKRLQIMEGDICDCAFLEEVFRTRSIESVIHLAARAGVRPSLRNPALYAKVNCIGTMNLLEMARRFAVEKFLFASTSAVYGANEKVPFSEDDSVEHQVSPYGATKRACELFCRSYHELYGIPMCCIRFFTAYGPRQRPDMAIHKFTKAILEGRPLDMYGDGTSARDYTYVSDIIDGVVAALEADVAFEIVNLGDSRMVTLKQLIGLLERVIGKKASVNKMPTQSGDMPRTYADITKAKRLLGYEPRYGIEKGLEEFVKWYRTEFT